MASETPRPSHHVFVSHTAHDKDRVRPLAAALKVAGGDVWLDEWMLKPGDSLPGSISAALEKFDTFVVVWSERAAQSNWVATELKSAISRKVDVQDCRIVPVILDDTPRPALLRDLLYIDARTTAPLEIAKSVLGIDSDRALRIALQRTLNDLELEEFVGVGVLIGCPQCGASVDKIRAGEWWDDARDDRYVGAECTECGWGDASDM